MFSRKQINIDQQSELPKKWTDYIRDKLNKTFESECTKQERIFHVFSEVYPEELVMISSLHPIREIGQSSITLFISVDIKEDQKLQQNIFDELLDFAAVVFQDVLSNLEWNEFEPNFIKTTFVQTEGYYKITRENILLTIEANKLLKDSGFNPLDD